MKKHKYYADVYDDDDLSFGDDQQRVNTFHVI